MAKLSNLARSAKNANHKASFEKAAALWGGALNKRVAVATKGQDRVLRSWCLNLLGLIVLKSPVDTGRSRAGWFAAIDALGGRTPSGGDAEAVAEGRSMGSAIVKRGFIRIVNAVKYIVPLEFGHSGQAPFGMVRISMQEMARGRESLTEKMKEFYKTAFASGKALKAHK